MSQPVGDDRPMDQDKLLDHNYDGIQEYDNPMPRWWLATLWGAVLFAVVYAVNVIPGVGIGRGRYAAYAADSARADSSRAQAPDPLSAMTDDSLLRLAAAPTTRALGQTTFASYCVACHAADGGGGIGPNLTDDYWLHGGRPTQVLHTINVGVLEKGMPNWGASIPPDQLIAVTAYVTALRGTRPAAPKAPQGVVETTPAPAAVR